MNAAVPQEADAPNEIELCQFPAAGDKPMARVYACGGDEHYAYLRIDIGEKRIAMSPEQWANLGTEVETQRIQLAACGVAALCNTPESAEKNRLAPDSKYRSGSYDDVCRLVGSEMALREQLREAEDCLALTHKALRLMAERHREPEPPALPERHTVSELPSAEFA